MTAIANYVCGSMRTGLEIEYDVSGLSNRYVTNGWENFNEGIDWASYMLSRLPSGLVNSLQEASTLSYVDLIHDINRALRKTEIRTRHDTLIWFDRAAESHREICWSESNVGKNIMEHDNIMAAILNIMTDPSSIQNEGLGRVFFDVNSRLLKTDAPHCLRPEDNDYAKISNLIKTYYLEHYNKETVDGFRDTLRPYSHPFLRAVRSASQNSYTCTATDDCHIPLRFGHLYVPTGFRDYLIKLRAALDPPVPVCITLGDAKVPSDSYWISISDTFE
ncbi:hypothetical protein CDD83_5869 [Cordyceps sp. RAO-2017]|nr:hypothetical protein CDD83_5869 [Cordyceps sp. RAO-2017]